MKKLFFLLSFISINIFSFSQDIGICGLPTTTVSASGDLLIKNKANCADINGTEAITVGNFISSNGLLSSSNFIAVTPISISTNTVSCPTCLIRGTNTYTANTILNATGTFNIKPSSTYSLVAGGDIWEKGTGAFVRSVQGGDEQITSDGHQYNEFHNYTLWRVFNGANTQGSFMTMDYNDFSLSSTANSFSVDVRSNNSSGTQINFFKMLNTGIVITTPTLTITGLGAGAGKVLTSDANGVSTWQTPSSSAALTNTYIGFGASSVLSGSSDFIWNNTSKNITQNNSSASGNTGHTFSIGTEFAGFAKYGSSYTSTYTGTSVNLASTFGISHINLTPVCLPVFAQALPFYISTGLTSSDLAYRFDATGLKITTNANLHTSGSTALDIGLGYLHAKGITLDGASSGNYIDIIGNGTMAAPGSGTRIYGGLTGNLNIFSSYGYKAEFAFTSMNANRTYTLPDLTGIFVVSNASTSLTTLPGDLKMGGSTGLQNIKSASGSFYIDMEYGKIWSGGNQVMDLPTNLLNSVSSGVATLDWNGRTLQNGAWAYDANYGLEFTGNSIVNKTYVDSVKTAATSKTFLTAQSFTTGVTAPKTVLTYTTSASDNFFRVSGTINVTAISLDNIRYQVLYTDEQSNSNTLDMQFATNGGVTFANVITATGGYGIAPVDIRVKASTVITIQVNPVVGTGSATFNAGAIIQQL